jgi:hypothetical protein
MIYLRRYRAFSIHRRVLEVQSREEVAKERFWRLRPDDITILPPVGNKTGIFCILEHKRILTRGKRTTEAQYVSLHSVISTAIQIQGWRVEQISFIMGGRSVNKEDLRAKWHVRVRKQSCKQGNHLILWGV